MFVTTLVIQKTKMHANIKDVTGQKFGLLIVLKYLGKDKKSVWLCQCDCGKKVKVFTEKFRSKLPNCGCQTRRLLAETKLKNLIGQRFGRLEVLEYSHKKTRTYWQCRCDCGRTKIIRGNDMVNGKTVSCGCKTKEDKEGLRNDLEGQRFGELKVIRCISSIGEFPKKYLCKCSCEKEPIVQYSNLVSGATQSCGWCSNDSLKYYERINGVIVSSVQKKIQQIIGGELNYKIGRYYGDIVFVDDKIVVEYNEKFWHEGREEKDLKRTHYLTNSGWGVLHINTNGGFPNNHELFSILDYLKDKSGEVVNLNI